MKTHLLCSLLMLAGFANANAAGRSEPISAGPTPLLGVEADPMVSDRMDRAQLALEVVCTAKNSKYCCYYGNSGSLFACSKWVPKDAIRPKEVRPA